MYKRELKYIVIEYSDKDLLYINDLCKYIEQSCEEIISFFDIKEFGKKVNIKLWDNLENFRRYYKKVGSSLDEKGETCNWVCGFSNGDIIHSLCLDEYKKTKFHENNTLQDLKFLVMHEFTHSCHSKINKPYYTWLAEGLATTITHQMENTDRILNFSLEQALDGGCDYQNYHIMFSYVYETYGRNYILNLIRDNELLKKDTPKLYEETVRLYGNNKTK